MICINISLDPSSYLRSVKAVSLRWKHIFSFLSALLNPNQKLYLMCLDQRTSQVATVITEFLHHKPLFMHNVCVSWTEGAIYKRNIFC